MEVCAMLDIHKQLLAKTAGVLPTDKREPDAARRKTPFQTPIGVTGALAVAQMRIQELEAAGALTRVPIDSIEPNPWQPRRTFNETKLSVLARSIAQVGLLQAITIRRAPDKKFQLVAGERRWRAYRLLNEETIPAVVIECSDEAMETLALTENFTRDDLSDYEIAFSAHLAEGDVRDRTRRAKALGITCNDLERYRAFDGLPDFVVRDLNITPSLLNVSAAQEIANALKEHGEPALCALREVWPLVLSCDLAQSKVAAAIHVSLLRHMFPSNAADRVGGTLYAGKVEACVITKDVEGLIFEFKAGAITDDQYAELLDFMGKMFSRRPA